MRASPRTGRLLVAGVAVALGAIWLIPQVRVDENRVPPEWPTTSWEGIEDASLFQGIDTVLADRLPLKGSVVHRTADLIVAAGWSPRPTVFRGEDGMPFFTGDFTLPCDPTSGAAAAMPDVRALADQLGDSGTRLVYAIVPDKSSALRDQLGSHADALMRCADPVRESWEAVEDPTIFTAWDAFAAARSAGEDLYFFGDTHWNWHGAALYSQGLLDRLGELGVAPTGLDLVSELRSEGEVDHVGDLFLLMGVERIEKAEKLAVVRAGIDTTHEELEVGQRWTSTSTGAAGALIPGRTLVLRDSMFDYDGELLAPYFEDLTAVWTSDFLDSGADPGDYDLVIIQQVQRSVPEFLDRLVAPTGVDPQG